MLNGNNNDYEWGIQITLLVRASASTQNLHWSVPKGDAIQSWAHWQARSTSVAKSVLSLRVFNTHTLMFQRRPVDSLSAGHTHKHKRLASALLTHRNHFPWNHHLQDWSSLQISNLHSCLRCPLYSIVYDLKIFVVVQFLHDLWFGIIDYDISWMLILAWCDHHHSR